MRWHAVTTGCSRRSASSLRVSWLRSLLVNQMMRSWRLSALICAPVNRLRGRAGYVELSRIIIRLCVSRRRKPEPRRLLAELFPAPMSRVRLALRHLFGRAGALFRARDRLAEEFQRLGRTVITEYLMTLRLPGGQVLRLGQDLQAAFPPLLEHTTHPELQALLNKVDPTPDSLDETGAEDWGKLSDRMHFIADLFRAHHLDRTLYDPPFTVDQVAAIKIGDLPAGPL